MSESEESRVMARFEAMSEPGAMAQSGRLQSIPERR